MTEYNDEQEEVLETKESFNPSELTKTYVEASYREEEMRSSSISFFIVAILLIIVTVLVYLDIIPVAVGSTATKILDVTVLLIMAVIFLAVALYSIKRAKELSGTSNREVALTEEILEFCVENYQDPASEDSSETDRYFEREAYLRKMITGQYKGLADSYLDYLVETIYSELYPDEKEPASGSTPQ